MPDKKSSVFTRARPVWACGKTKEMNVTLGFRADFSRDARYETRLVVATSGIYRFFVNGVFAGAGPARGPHGKFRADVWNLEQHLTNGVNVLAIEVAGYNVRNYDIINQPSFLQAEVVCGGAVVAATAPQGGGFIATRRSERIQRVQRYSLQRTFIEAYRLAAGCGGWKTPQGTSEECVPLEECAEVELLPRHVSYPDFARITPIETVAAGTVEKVPQADCWRDRSITEVGGNLQGYPIEHLSVFVTDEVCRLRTQNLRAETQPFTGAVRLAENQCRIVRFEKNSTGFLGAHITCDKDCSVYFLFDELLTGGDVDFTRLICANVVKYECKAGSYEVETIEPYTLQYLKIIVVGGTCQISGITLREYTNPDTKAAEFQCGDESINSIFMAALETFNQNAVDIPTDCPSRERAGWLCDSFFIGRAEEYLTGQSLVERSFLENYLLMPQLDDLPAGMLPSCYPADVYDWTFIPNWAMWFVLELEEYCARTGDAAMVAQLLPKVVRLFDYFKGFRNESGLLEKLESWIFVEWSRAADFVQDVNYPTNMLYAAALDAAGRMYGREDWLQQAQGIREEIRSQSFNGEFFVDNAVRNGGSLCATQNVTEVCQYYAFFTDVCTPQSHPTLWKHLLDDFGPFRRESKMYPEVHPANVFVGYYLRMILLSRYGESSRQLCEIKVLFTRMAGLTGTLWENVTECASCNHGFASYAAYTIFKDILGVWHIDRVNRKIVIRLMPHSLVYCRGTLPLDGGALRVEWRRSGNHLECTVDVPEGYTTEVENCTGLLLVLR